MEVRIWNDVAERWAHDWEIQEFVTVQSMGHGRAEIVVDDGFILFVEKGQNEWLE